MKLEEVLPALRAGKIIRTGNILWKLDKQTLYSKLYFDHIWQNNSMNLAGHDILDTNWEIVEDPKCELCEGHKEINITPIGVSRLSEEWFSKVIDCPECCK